MTETLDEKYRANKFYEKIKKYNTVLEKRSSEKWMADFSIIFRFEAPVSSKKSRSRESFSATTINSSDPKRRKLSPKPPKDEKVKKQLPDMATKNDQDSTAAKGLINDIFGIKINKNKVRKNFDVINNYLEGRKLLKERLDV